MQQAFRGRKKDPTQNVMVAVNCDLKFTYVLAGWEGFAHDATVLADAVAREDGLSLPKGFGFDEVVPDEEGFTTSADPTNLPPAHLDQDSVDMAEIRDAICNAIPRMDLGAFEGGFVAGTSVMEQLINGGSAPVVASAGASAAAPVAASAGAGATPGAANPVDVAVPVAGNGAVRAMRWTNTTSGFVLRRMAALVSDGSRPEKVFKDKDVNSVAKALKQFCGEVVSPTQVYNHLRKWRQKWARVSKLKDLSAALWDDQAHAIMLEQETTLATDHPKDVEFLNCPIRFYIEMEAIFANAMATVPSEQGGDSKATGLLPTSSAAGPKRKRGNFSEEEMLMLTNMSDAVNNVANALRETGPAHVDANLYLAVMEMPGFSEEALIVAYTFLLDNKAQGRGFVNMSDAHRALWLRTFLAKNYYV
ncbi:uncharacterized protein [Miscanthus floridulus]|uniref:uncharacterized protein n=1 Tax=Miscanthus floridulus TaxID=154761 RepID=UPI003457D1AE